MPFAVRQVYDMLGNAWEWVAGGEPSKRTLRGGSFVDYDPTVRDPDSEADSPDRPGGPKRPANHAITPGTRMETTQDSGSINTSFRCASSVATGEPSRGTKGSKSDGEASGRNDNTGAENTRSKALDGNAMGQEPGDRDEAGAAEGEL